jgi:chromosomal replication initiation ATPase DnaA
MALFHEESVDELRAFAEEREGISLPHDVAWYVAATIATPRERQGAVIRIAAYASLTGHEITLPLDIDVLHEMHAVTH